jgi:2-polyprenyl-3-methyl-5-hydroxy-6-metoxy-1,4-benzoquinol methylase
MNAASPSLSIVIPAFNERRTIRELIRAVQRTPYDKEIIIVDDCSTDGTRQILKEYQNDPSIKLILLEANRGKGHAVKVGISAASKEVVIIQDADLEYDPEDYEALLRPIILGRADVVYGSRFLHGERRVLYFRHSIGNRILTLLSNIFTDLNLTDVETCYKVFKREIIQNIELESERFGFEPEVTAKVAKLGCAVYEVPIRYYGRSYAEGKKITWRDGVAAIFHIIRFSLSRRNFVKNKAAIRAAMVSPPPDPNVGVETLEAFEEAKRYNHWIYERVADHVSGRVLEVGSGIGNIVGELVTAKGVSAIVATDICSKSLATLRDRFGWDTRLSTELWNAEDPPSSTLLAEKFDTIISSNVIEHICDHEKALRHIRQLLKPDGKLIILVPAHPALFSGLDEDLGHFRRYSRAELLRVHQAAGFQVHNIFEHNFLGAAGWWWTGKIRKRRTLSARDTKTFDKLVPLLRVIDPYVAKVTGGVSLISISSLSTQADQVNEAPEKDISSCETTSHTAAQL